MSLLAIAPGEIPTVKELHSAAGGEGLEVSGMAATWDEDTADEAFLPNAFDAAISNYLQYNPVVLHHHEKSSPPIGFCRECKVTPRGLWVACILPAPTVGTKAFDIYHAVKARLISTWSVGGLWDRVNIGGKVKLMCKRLLELSLTSQPTNQYAQADSVVAVHGVKSIGGVWMPDSRSRWDAAIAEHRLRDLDRDLGLLELELDVCALLLG
jgi:HK97 family phage prohead protease